MRRSGGTLLILAAAVLWGTTGTAQELGPEGAPSTTIGAIRMAIGAAGLVAAVLATGARRTIEARWRSRLAVAAFAMAAYQPLFFGGVGRTGVAVGTIVAIGSAPVLAVALAYIARGERATGRWALATLLAVGGAALLLGGGEALGVDAVGVLMALGAGLSYAVFAVAAKDLVEGNDTVTVMAAVFVGAAILLAPYFFIDDVSWVTEASGAAVALHLGLLATTAAYLFFAAGLRRATVANAATLSLGEPLTAALLGILVVGERLSAGAWLGAAGLLAGLALVATSRTEADVRAVDPAPHPG